MRKRGNQLHIYLDENENKKLKSLMDKTNYTASQIIRRLIMNTEIRPRPPDEYVKLLRELSAIGNNINQLAHKANGIGVIHVDEVRKMREALEGLWTEVKKL